MEQVIVAVEEKYSDNNGNYQIAHVWNGECVTQIGGVYDSNVYSVNATPEQFKAASEWAKANAEANPTNNWNKYCYGGRGADTFIDCIVTLKRSRKAPNKIPLKVVNFLENVYDARFNNYTGERIEVTDGYNNWVVSSGCINEVIKGHVDYPFWAQ